MAHRYRARIERLSQRKPTHDAPSGDGQRTVTVSSLSTFDKPLPDLVAVKPTPEKTQNGPASQWSPLAESGLRPEAGPPCAGPRYMWVLRIRIRNRAILETRNLVCTPHHLEGPLCPGS